MTEHCPRCGRPVVVAFTDGGRRLTLDPEPSALGTLELSFAAYADGGGSPDDLQRVRYAGRVRARRQLTFDDLINGGPPPVPPRWRAHVQTCPRERRRRGGNRSSRRKGGTR